MSDLGEDYSSGISRFSLGDEPQFDDYADAQAELLAKGKDIEMFMNAYRDTCGDETCFKLLEILFKLFKSEFMTNLSLRKALVEHENRLREVSKYKSQIKTISSLFEQKITLDQIMQVVSECASNGMFKRGAIERAQDHLKKAEEATERCQSEILLIDQKVTEVRQRREMVDSRRISLNTMENKEKDLKEELNNLKREKAQIELNMIESNKTLTEQLTTIQQKVKQTEANMRTITQSDKEIISKLEHKKRRLESDIQDRRGGLAEFEDELDSVHKKIDYLTDPLVIRKRGRDSPHLARYHLWELQQRCAQLQQELKEETNETNDIQSQIEDIKDVIADSENTLRKQNNEITELKRLCSVTEANLHQLQKLCESLNSKRKEIKKLDRTRMKMLAEKTRIKHSLERSRSKVRELEIDAHSLGKSLEVVENSRQTETRTLKRVALSEFDNLRFNEIVNAFKMMRVELEMPEDTTPTDILSLFCNLDE